MAEIKTITYNGTTYDIGGLTNEAITALLNCFAHVAWADANGQSYYTALADALGSEDSPTPETYSITNNLTGVQNSNSSSSVSSGSPYTATLTPTSGYITQVVVTMGGTDITSQVFTGIS